MLANTFVCEVEFLGGPVDGHLESLSLPVHSYVGVKVLWSTETEAGQSSDSQTPPSSRGTRVAIYQLDNSRSRISYRFLRTQLLSDQTTRSPDNAMNSLANEHRRSG